ncbi:MAG TPA: class I SAM-dependent methyltransferase [Miltoncostaeaceae bacterium]|nr:class I SAM-dependent methyltransferase [Miltoncostaeaceae bacterium]
MSDDGEARRFALEHAHYVQDLPFWRAAAARCGSPVLDLGAATGRVAIPLARDGHEVWALDRSRAMLAELGRRLRREPPDVAARVRPVAGDIAALRLPGEFPLVIAAMNTLQVLTDPADRLACLRGVRAHLAAGGELAFEVGYPDPDEIIATMGIERSNGHYRDGAAGPLLLHSGWYDGWDPRTRTLDFTLRVEEHRAGARPREFLRRHRVHLFWPDEVEELLEQAGLEPVEAAADFAGTPLAPGAERQVYRCRARP